MLRIYLGLAGTLAVLLVITTQFLSPSVMLGFRSIAQFDLAFGIMVMGMLLTLPVNIAAALYRARGLYGRAVKLVNLGMMGALFGWQIAAIAHEQAQVAVSGDADLHSNLVGAAPDVLAGSHLADLLFDHFIIR
jgi:hypothetical protein